MIRTLPGGIFIEATLLPAHFSNGMGFDQGQASWLQSDPTVRRLYLYPISLLLEHMKKKSIDISAHLKKVQLLNPAKSLDSQGGFHCSVCSATFKSYEILLDHQNSKIHLQNIGYDKKAAMAGPELGSIKAKLAALKQAKERTNRPAVEPEALLKHRLKKAEEQEDAERRSRYEKKKLARRRNKLEMPK